MSETLTALKELLSTIFEFAVQEEPQVTSSSGWEMIVTIVAGVVVFVVCEWLKETWLSPLQEYKKLKLKVSRLLIVHAQYYANPITIDHQMNQEYSQASSEIRELASEVSSFAEIIPRYRLGIPSPKIIVEAGKKLIGLSNGFFVSTEDTALVHSKLNVETRERIKTLLKLRGVSKE